MILILIQRLFPVWLRVCWYVDLALAHSLGASSSPDITCTFNRDDGSGSRRDFLVGCPGVLAASQACYVTDRWFTPHFSVLARFRIDAWMDVASPVACQPLWPACWILLTCLLRHRLTLFRMGGLSFFFFLRE